MNSPVLLLGETGTGKELIAAMIHRQSERRDNALVTINCGAIPDTLLDSELFGHEKGAFTGALTQKKGHFERANGGTVFLDEVGELPPQAQVRLLRVLQNGEIQRVGGTGVIPVDIRIIAATHQDLEAMVKQGNFREDLWFRLNVFTILLPALRERSNDIPALVQYFIEKKSKSLNMKNLPRLREGCLDPLIAYSWPGNVRELENIIERALILYEGGPLSFDHLIPSLKDKKISWPEPSSDRLAPLDTVIRNHLEKALRAADGKIHGKGGAAELVNINADTFRSKMRKLGMVKSKKALG
jgi:transcriptional regulator with GAF, ATPase, and Fis domain